MLIRQPLVINNRDFILTFAISLKPQYADYTEEIILDKLENDKHFDINGIVENYYYIVNSTNQKYSEAYDPAEFGRTYTETDEIVPDSGDMPTPEPEPADEPTKTELLGMLNELGVDTND